MLTPVVWLLFAAQSDPLLAEAARAADEFTARLPDFMCLQVLRRAASPHRYAEWQHLDTITAEVAYEQGHEVRRSVVRAGKPIARIKDLLDSGPWSQGEWGNALVNLFDPTVHATFLDAGPYLQMGSRGRKYRFAVLAAHSRWRVTHGKASILAAYNGMCGSTRSPAASCVLPRRRAACPRTSPSMSSR